MAVLPPEIVKLLPALPGAAKGTVETQAKGWARALYYDPVTSLPITFQEPPTVVAIAELREGLAIRVTAPTITIPTIDLPTPPQITIPDVNIPLTEIPKLDIAAWKCAMYISTPFGDIECPGGLGIGVIPIELGGTEGHIEPCPTHGTQSFMRISLDKALWTLFRSNAAEALGNWGWLNWARDAVINALASIGSGISKPFFDFWYRGILPQITKIQEKINESFKTAIGDPAKPTQNSLNWALDKTREEIQSKVNQTLSDTRNKTQTALNTYRDTMQTSVNEGLNSVIPRLYEMMGLPIPLPSEEEKKRLREMGDVNGDWTIDQKDLDLIKSALGKRKGEPGYVEAYDLNHDGVINLLDATIASSNFGKGISIYAQLLSPVQIRNVTTGTFEFYALSPKMRVHYIAFGKRVI